MFATILLVVNGLAFVLTGLLGLVKPDPFAGSVGLGLDGAAGHNEFLGTFGGLYLAVGLLLLLPRPLDQQARLWLLVALAGGLAVGRGDFEQDSRQHDIGRLGHLAHDPARPVRIARPDAMPMPRDWAKASSPAPRKTNDQFQSVSCLVISARTCSSV